MKMDWKGDFGAIIFLLMGVVFVGVYTGTLKTHSQNHATPKRITPPIKKHESLTPKISESDHSSSNVSATPKKQPILIYHGSSNWTKDSGYVTLQTGSPGIETTATVRCFDINNNPWQKTVQFGLSSPSTTVQAPQGYNGCYLVAADPPGIKMAYGKLS